MAEAHGAQDNESVESLEIEEDVISENMTTPETYILTEENITTIDPMIGLTAEDVAVFK